MTISLPLSLALLLPSLSTPQDMDASSSPAPAHASSDTSHAPNKPDLAKVRQTFISCLRTLVTFKSLVDLIDYERNLPEGRLREIEVEILLELYEPEALDPQSSDPLVQRLRDFHKLRLTQNHIVHGGSQISAEYAEFLRIRRFGVLLLQNLAFRWDFSNALRTRILRVLNDQELGAEVRDSTEIIELELLGLPELRSSPSQAQIHSAALFDYWIKVAQSQVSYDLLVAQRTQSKSCHNRVQNLTRSTQF